MYPDERHFVKTASRSMYGLEQIWTANSADFSEKNREIAARALGEIKTVASTVEARGVYRAAALCNKALKQPSGPRPNQMDAALIGLKHLISQYADGLYEIDPEFKREMENGAPVAAPAPRLDIKSNIGIAKSHEKAAQILSPLMHLVKDPKRRNALSRIMQQPSIDVSNQPVLDRNLMSFDAMMHPLTNLILGEARHSAKSVSISYASDFNHLERQTADKLSEILEVICLNIVANGISAGSKPAGAASQISVTGQKKQGRFDFTISWIGTALSNNAGDNSHFAKALAKIERAGGETSFKKAIFNNAGAARQALTITWPNLPAHVLSRQTTGLTQFERTAESGGI